MNLFYCSPRQRDLLDRLTRTDDWLTGADLSKDLGVSDRTIRNDVVVLNYILEQYNSSIISERGKGYRLQSGNHHLLTMILNQYQVSGSQREQRFYEIMFRLMFADHGVALCDLEDTLFISRTTLESELKKIRAALLDFYPSIDIKREHGRVELIGCESSIRFLLNELIMLQYDPGNQTMSLSGHPIDNTLFYSIHKTVVETADRYQLTISDQGIADIAAYLAVASIRIKRKKMLDSVARSKDRQPDMIDQLAEELFLHILKPDLEDSNFDEIEIDQIAVKLSFINLRQPSDTTRDAIIQYVPASIIAIVNSLIDTIHQDFHLDLSNDDELFISLVFHIKALIYRVKYQQMVENPILELIKTKYPFIFELSLHIHEIFFSVLNIRLTESEVSYVAAHIAAGIERTHLDSENKPLQLSLVSHLPSSYSQILIAGIRTKYGNYAEVAGPYPAYKMREIISGQPALILTTSSTEATRTVNGIRIINISPAPTEEEHMIILKALEEARTSMLYKSPGVGPGVASKFHRSAFFADLAFNTPEEVISFLSYSLQQNGFVPRDFLEETMARERLASTELDHRIAIPHPLRAMAYKTVIGVAMLRRPIQWGKCKAQLILMPAVRNDEKPYIRDVFRFISRLMDDEEKVNQLLRAKSFSAFTRQIELITGEINQTMLHTELIYCDVPAKNRREALTFIGEKLHQKGYVKESYTQALLDREAYSPTGLPAQPCAVAIPHTDCAHVLKPCLIFLRLAEAVPFQQMGTPDQSVDVKFLFGLVFTDGKKQIPLLSSVMKLIQNHDDLTAIDHACDPQEILKIISKYIL